MNYLDSSAFAMQVDNSPPGTSTQDILLTTLLIIGFVGIGAYLLDIFNFRKRTETTKSPPSKRKPI